MPAALKFDLTRAIVKLGKYEKESMIVDPSLSKELLKISDIRRTQ